MTKIKTKLGQMAVATMLATGLLVVAQTDSADATFSGKNGVIAFESSRTTGKDVHNPTGDTEIFTANPEGTGIRQLTHNEAEDFSPAFSPDGRQIAFVSERDGDLEVYKMKADGSVARDVTQKPSNPSWQARLPMASGWRQARPGSEDHSTSDGRRNDGMGSPKASTTGKVAR